MANEQINLFEGDVFTVPIGLKAKDEAGKEYNVTFQVTWANCTSWNDVLGHMLDSQLHNAVGKAAFEQIKVDFAKGPLGRKAMLNWASLGIPMEEWPEKLAANFEAFKLGEPKTHRGPGSKPRTVEQLAGDMDKLSPEALEELLARVVAKQEAA